jgi:hypothetical protein
MSLDVAEMDVEDLGPLAEQRITSKISRAGSSSISAMVPWQKLSP